MCGIVGAVAQRDVVPVLIEGLRRLEYRGYDSAGVAVLNGSGTIKRLRAVGKVRMLQDVIDKDPTHGLLGIAHTRWATHGVPSERNAHPHISKDGIALVHNGIIENHDELRAELLAAGYEFSSETDTEVIAHRVHYHLQKTGDLFKAVRATVAELEGAYALAVISQKDPERIVLAREGCPVVVGLGDGESCVASTWRRCCPSRASSCSWKKATSARSGATACASRTRTATRSSARCTKSERLSADAAEKGDYPHYMLKEIHEQPRAVAQTLEERVAGGKLARGRVRPGRTGRVREDGSGAHRRVRYQLPRGLRREVFHRADLPSAVLGGDRERVSLSQPGGAEEHAVRQRVAVR